MYRRILSDNVRTTQGVFNDSSLFMRYLIRHIYLYNNMSNLESNQSSWRMYVGGQFQIQTIVCQWSNAFPDRMRSNESFRLTSSDQPVCTAKLIPLIRRWIAKVGFVAGKAATVTPILHAQHPTDRAIAWFPHYFPRLALTRESKGQQEATFCDGTFWL